MHDEVTVSIDEFVAALNNAASTARDLRECLAGIARDVDALMHGGWTGQVAGGFDRCWLEWRHAAESVVEALADTAHQLGGAADSYHAGDTQNAESIGTTASKVDDLG